MTNKVVPLPKKTPRLHSKKLLNNYTRVSRENSTLIPPVPDEEKDAYDDRSIRNLNKSHPEVEHMWLAVETKPFNTAHGVGYFKMENIIHKFNPLLLYRILKLSYGDADVVSAISTVPRQKDRSADIFSEFGDWAYLLRICDELYVEIRSKYSNTHIVLQFWSTIPEEKISDRKKIKDDAVRFSFRLEEDYLKNLHLFREAEFISSAEVHMILNLCSERYEAGKILYKLASVDISDDFEASVVSDDCRPFMTLKYIYLSAATQFIISLEALVNLLYHFLLKHELRTANHVEKIRRRDIESNLAEIHMLCTGFTRSPVPLGSELWTQFQEMRNLRNEIFHGNITDEHKLFGSMEDNRLFQYLPAIHYRGSRKEGKIKLSPSMLNFDADHVDEIRKVVDDVRDALVGAMNEDTRDWVLAWIDQSVVTDPTT